MLKRDNLLTESEPELNRAVKSQLSEKPNPIGALRSSDCLVGEPKFSGLPASIRIPFRMVRATYGISFRRLG